jgi:transposase
MLSDFSGDLGPRDFILLFVDGAGNHHSDELEIPANIILHLLPPYSPELNPQENLWDEIREKIFKNYALKSMDDVNAKLDEAAFYIERNSTLVKSITSFPYIASHPDMEMALVVSLRILRSRRRGRRLRSPIEKAVEIGLHGGNHE